MIPNIILYPTKMETNHFNKIDDYLLEKLTNKEAQEFEKEMAADEELQQQVQLCRELKDAILETDIVNLRKQLSEASKEVKPAARGGLSNLIKVAAVLVVMAVSTFFLWKVYDTPTSLFDKYYTRYEMPTTSSRGNEPMMQNIQAKIVDFYRHGKLDNAIPDLQKYVKTRPEDQVGRLMLVSAYLENNQAANAEALLKSTIERYSDGLYTETAEWYLCLAYINQAKYNDAFILANKIKINGGKYASKAKEINDYLTDYLKE